MKEILRLHLFGVLLFAYLICGLYTYQAATILMKGSIFQPLRSWIENRADDSRFFEKVKEMLGCMLCTATEVAIWTIGLPFVVLALQKGFWEQVAGTLPWWQNFPLAIFSGFVIALAVAALAWGYHEFAGHRADKFIALRNEYEGELGRLRGLLFADGGKDASAMELETLLPYSAFEALYDELLRINSCSKMWCPYSRATCRVRKLRDSIRIWWEEKYRGLFGRELEIVAGIFSQCIVKEDPFYWLFFNHDPAKTVYERLTSSAKKEMPHLQAAEPTVSDLPKF